VTTDQSGSSFFEDSYVSHFFVKNLLGYHPSKSICGVFINDLTTEQTCHNGIVTRPYTFIYGYDSHSHVVFFKTYVLIVMDLCQTLGERVILFQG